MSTTVVYIKIINTYYSLTPEFHCKELVLKTYSYDHAREFITSQSVIAKILKSIRERFRRRKINTIC